jgi:hypothetical protein
MTYELAGETLLPNYQRECGHPFILPADECELCDIDWLLETGWSEDEEELQGLRSEFLAEASA